jgi:hypothetical protein
MTEKPMENRDLQKAVRRQRHLKSGADFPTTSPHERRSLLRWLGKRSWASLPGLVCGGSDRRAQSSARALPIANSSRHA